MKYSEWKILNNVHTEEEVTVFFRNNMLTGKLPVAIEICPLCQEVLTDYSKPCPGCSKETCSICGNLVDQIVVLDKSNYIKLGFYSARINNVDNFLCSDCYEKWAKITIQLFSRFKKNKKIDVNTKS